MAKRSVDPPLVRISWLFCRLHDDDAAVGIAMDAGFIVTTVSTSASSFSAGGQVTTATAISNLKPINDHLASIQTTAIIEHLRL